MAEEPAANADQIAYWNSAVGERWATLQIEIDALFAPLGAAALAFAAPRAGEAVLDVGCGCGATVLDLAAAVGPTGRVRGVDVSTPMLDLARRRVAEQELAQVDLALGDASCEGFEAGVYDLVFSRFGVMFFNHPTAAFAHLRTALAPGGRLAFACWQPMTANPWFAVPVEAVLPLVGPQPSADPTAPGPFAFADPDRVRAILAGAGFSDIAIAPFEAAMRLAGPGDRATAAGLLSQLGAAARLLKEAGPEIQAAGRAAIETALRPYDGAGGVVLGGAVWLVSARA